LLDELFQAIYLIDYSEPKRKPYIPHAIPATTKPAGGNINPAPMLVNIINETINKLANVLRFLLFLNQEINLFQLWVNLAI